MDHLQHHHYFVHHQSYSNPIHAIVDRFHWTRESSHYGVTIELEKLRLYEIQMCVISISNFADPTMQRSKNKIISPIESETHEQTLSPEPVARIYSEKGLNDRQFTSALCASTTCDGLLQFDERVSQLEEKNDSFQSKRIITYIINLWSSPTEPKRVS